MENAGTLMQRTITLLTTTEKPLSKLSQETGLSLYWLQKFKSGLIEDPSVNAVQTLYEHLSQSRLKV